MSRRSLPVMLVVVAASGAFGLIAGAGEFEVSWSTIDAGGAQSCMGGAFELSGTIGQTDAGELAGGEFTLTGGFWFPVVPGDANADGGVDLSDLDKV